MSKKKSPRHEVISLRLNEERLKLLERSRELLASQLGRPVSLAEAAFLVVEARAVGLDRAASRFEMLQTPTASLYRIRKRWESQHTLSAAEWDVLAEFVLAGTEEERQEPPALQPAIPSRASYLALLDAFQAVYEKRQEEASPRVWSYFGNLDGYHTPVLLSDTDADQRHRALLDQIATQRRSLQNDEQWQAPGYVGRCLAMAIRDEGVESTDLDHVLAVYWPTLWGVAARGHWTRYRRPIRIVTTAGPVRLGLDEDHFPRLTVGEFSLSFMRAGGPELATTLHVGRTRTVTIQITHYPELAELHAMLARATPSWHGTYFHASPRFDAEPMVAKLWCKRRAVSLELFDQDWQALRTVVGEAWQHPALQPLLQELRQEYGEQG
ncbi:MAG: hypothetical protein ABJA98_06735 [Acidobacteriota bacterium]